MKRKDLLPIAALIALLFLWGPIARTLFPPPDAPPPAPPERPGIPPAELALPAEIEPDAVAEPAETPAETAPEQPPAVRAEEQRVILANADAEIALTSWGAGVGRVRLLNYRAAIDPDSPPVELDFEDQPALTYRQAAGFSSNRDFTITRSAADSAQFEARSREGLVMTREYALDPDNSYRFHVTDTFKNTSDAPLPVAAHAIRLGTIRPESEAGPRTRIAGLDLGLDALPSGGGRRVRHWGKKRFMSREKILTDLFMPDGYRGGGCMARRPPRQLPATVGETVGFDTDWVAVKNKFFVQILAPRENAAGYRFDVGRVVSPGEHPDRPETWESMPRLASIAAELDMPGVELAPGETFERRYSYYAGPKQYSSLEMLGNHQETVMEFGRLRFVCRLLLGGLNGLYAVIPNYGIAVMLLTILIRVIFWPITRKSTESMRRMQQLQPEMQAIRARYKDNPQKVQRETMALYKKHKVNPVAGCLPMLIQIPVFFALFTVLRSAVELRFAPFLWVRDLSEPENLLAGMIPIVGSLNILPVLMTVTMVWQQHLTPTAGDPAQRKMMVFMPVIMLVFFYSMPSALVLYWTTNQCLMIVQLMRRKHRKEAAGNGGAPAPAAVAAPPPAARKRKR